MNVQNVYTFYSGAPYLVPSLSICIAWSRSSHLLLGVGTSQWREVDAFRIQLAALSTAIHCSV